MNHPLYPMAQRLMGRRVNIHHISGRVYCGQLHSVTQSGIYVSECTPSYINFQADTSQSLEDDLEFVYSPLAYFGFGALAGLTVGALAGRRGYYW